MAKTTNPSEESETASAPKLNTKLSPMFRAANEPDGKVPFAHEIGGLHIQVPDPSADNKSKRVKIPNEHWFLAKNGKVTKQEPGQAAPAEWVFDPSKTSEKEFEAHFGRGEYWIQPININNSFMACGRMLSLGGPRRFQGIVLKANEVIVDGDIYALKPGETFVNGQVVSPVEEEEEEIDDEEDEENDEEGEEGEPVETSKQMQDLIDKVLMLTEQLAQARFQAQQAPVAPSPSREEYWQTEIAKLRTQYTDDTTRSHTAHIQEIARLRQEQTQEANQQRNLQEQATANLRSAFQSELNGLKDGHRADFENMRKDLREQITQLRTENDNLRREHRSELDVVRKGHDEEMKAERTRFGSELAAKTEDTKESRTELREQLRTVESEFRLYRGSAEQSLSTLRTAMDTDLSKLRSENATLNNQLARVEMLQKDAERRVTEAHDRLSSKTSEADKARERAEREAEEAEDALKAEYRRAAEREVPMPNAGQPQRNPEDEPPVPEYILKYGPAIWEQGKKMLEDNREQNRLASEAAQQAAAAVVAAQQATAAAVAAQDELRQMLQAQAQREWEQQQQARVEWEARQSQPQAQQAPPGQYWQPINPNQQQQPPPPENHPPAPQAGVGASHSASYNGAGTTHPEEENSTPIVE